MDNNDMPNNGAQNTEPYQGTDSFQNTSTNGYNGDSSNPYLNNSGQNNFDQNNFNQNNYGQNNFDQNNFNQNNYGQNNFDQNNFNQNTYSPYQNNGMNQPPLDKKGRPMQNRFTMKMVFSILEILTCNLISLVCGIIGIVTSSKANKAYKEGRWNDFMNSARSSAIALWVGLGGFILNIVVSVVCIIFLKTMIFSYINTYMAPTEPVDSWADFIEFCYEHDTQNSTPDIDDDYDDYLNDITGDGSTGDNGTDSDTYDDGATLDDDYLNQDDDTTYGWENPDAAKFDDSSFTLAGKTYTLPFEFKKLKKAGFHLDEEDSSTVLESDTFGVGYLYDEDDNFICNLYFTNQGKKDAKLKDCSVTGISISSDYYSKDVDFTLMDKITFSSTEKEVKKVLGTPGDIYTPDDGSLDMLTWYGKDYDYNFYDSLNISFTDKEMTTISMMYIGK